MRQTPAHAISGRPTLTCKPAGPVLLLAGLILSGLVQADDLSECMASRMLQVEDNTTIAELRLACQKALSENLFVPEEKAPEVVSERIRQDKENVLQPFTLMSHRPNYILLAAYNASGYDPEPYRQLAGNQFGSVDDTEVQFQVSIKTPLAVGLFDDRMDLYAAYTNRSFWQLYNDASSPFRETNHEPEVWAQFNPGWKFLGFTNTANTLGVVHQSNGRGGDLSRSWNRIYASLILERGSWAFAFKPWYRIPEDDEDDDNPDIEDYLGHHELRIVHKRGQHVFSAMSRNNIESGFSRGAVELAWSFPLGDYPYLKGYVQYFSGYGESLIDYDQYVHRIGFGLALTDWL